MERKKISLLGMIYIALLFIVYEMMLRITKFKINAIIQMSDRGYSNVLEVFNSIFYISIIIYKKKFNYSTYIFLTVLISSTVFQLLYKYLFRLKKFYKSKELVSKKRILELNVEKLGIILVLKSMKNLMFLYYIARFLNNALKEKSAYIFNVKFFKNHLKLTRFHSLHITEIKSVKKVEIKIVSTIKKIFENRKLIFQIKIKVEIKGLLIKYEKLINNKSIRNLIEKRVSLVTSESERISFEFLNIKKFCRFIISLINKIYKNTQNIIIRFKNVLERNGAIIPIFRKLLKKRKNLAVIHKEIKRYFMMIPEGVRLWDIVEMQK